VVARTRAEGHLRSPRPPQRGHQRQPHRLGVRREIRRVRGHRHRPPRRHQRLSENPPNRSAGRPSALARRSLTISSSSVSSPAGPDRTSTRPTRREKWGAGRADRRVDAGRRGLGSGGGQDRGDGRSGESLPATFRFDQVFQARTGLRFRGWRTDSKLIRKGAVFPGNRSGSPCGEPVRGPPAGRRRRPAGSQ
jgi:hypothetical protein